MTAGPVRAARWSAEAMEELLTSLHMLPISFMLAWSVTISVSHVT